MSKLSHQRPDAEPQSNQPAPSVPPFRDKFTPSASEVCGTEYLSVKEAAGILRVSERSVYTYIEKGKLAATYQGHLISIETAAVRQFRRQASGRPRVRHPEWHRSTPENGQVLTHVSVAVRAGQRDILQRRLEEINTQRRHHLPGTIARYIAYEAGEPERVRIVLIWRKAAMPPEEERITALADLYNDLSEVLDWDTALFEEEELWLHT